jgi:hypothetical protein
MVSKEQPDLIKAYLDRIKAREKSPDLQEYTERIASLAKMKSLLAGLSTKGFVVEDGPSVLGDQGEDSQLGTPDFVVRREDVLFYVYLVLGSERTIDHDYAQAIFQALRRNLGLTAVILVWPTENFSSCEVDSYAIRRHLEKMGNISLSEERAAPLLETIETAFANQFVDWQVTAATGAELRNRKHLVSGLSDSIREALKHNLAEEKARNLSIPEKVIAQNAVSDRDIAELTDEILRILSSESEAETRLESLSLVVKKLAGR